MRSNEHRIVIFFVLFFILCLPCLTLIYLTPAKGQVTPVIITNIELVTVDEYSAAITWVTNIPSNTMVQWGETDQLGEESVEDGPDTFHMGRISELSPGTEYYYRVGSDGRWSEISNFTTLTTPGGGFKLKIAIVADTHYDVDGTNTPNGMMYGESTHLLRSLVDELNNDTALDLVITVGDLVNNGQEVDYQGFTNEMNKLNVKWYPVLGNHDKSYPGWSDWYNDTIGLPKTYYSVDHSGYHFIMLDSAVQGQIKGDLDDEQLDWLESDLDANKAKPTIIFMHHEPHTTDINGIDEDAKDRLEDILHDRYNVLSITYGHVHQNHVTASGYNHTIVNVAAVVSYPIGYGMLRLYGDGYTQSFHKLSTELETSEDSRLRMTATGGPSADDEALGELEDRSIVIKIPEPPQIPEPPKNRAPTISSAIILPESILTGDTATITVIATDPDGDTLTYIYNVDDGTIEGAGGSVTYHAPQVSGLYNIRVKVYDGEYYSDENSIEIEVRAQDILINHAPRIEDVSANKVNVKVGDIVNIEVTATDDDGDAITYNYDPSGGVISGTDSEVTWEAPDYPGEFTIKVWVSDGEMESRTEKITISVTEADEQVDDDWSIPGFELVGLVIAIFTMIVTISARRKHN